MTQHQLAEAVAMPQPSIARIERGAVVPRTGTLLRIMEATGHQLSVEPANPPMDREAVRRLRAQDPSMRTRRAVGTALIRDPLTSPARILKTLSRNGVPFVLIGDLAEAAHGAPVKVGRVIEVCHATTDVARERLAKALRDLGASAPARGEVRTEAGRLRLTTETAAGDRYELLARTAEPMFVVPGLRTQVASLEDLIRIRLAPASAENRQAAAVLRAIVAESTA